MPIGFNTMQQIKHGGSLDILPRHLVVTLLRNEQGGRCFYCNQEITRKESTVDHLTPLCKGGTNKLGNLVIACSPCNGGKGGRFPTQQEIAKKNRQTQAIHRSYK